MGHEPLDAPHRTYGQSTRKNRDEPPRRRRSPFYPPESEGHSRDWTVSWAQGGDGWTDPIPSCDQAPYPNMPCYAGPFCLNAQLEGNANSPYARTPAVEACFPGLACKRPRPNNDTPWGGWGAPYDYYFNLFCCLTGECGSDNANRNYNCFRHGQTPQAYSCRATNPKKKSGAPNMPADITAAHPRQSTPTTGELALAACAAVASAD